MKTIYAFLIQLLFVGGIIAQNPPVGLQTVLTDSTTVQLEWQAPIEGQLSELAWTTGTNNNAVGLTGGGSFSIAARWEPSQITPYAGYAIRQVSFFANSSASSFTLKVWKGTDASLLIYSQTISNITSGEWNLITLNDAVPIDADQELWIGMDITNPANEYPAGIDAGPAVAGYGDKVKFQGYWENLSNFGLSSNWSLKAILQNSGGKIAELGKPAPEQTAYTGNGTLKSIRLHPVKDADHAVKSPTEVPDGYKVYRNQQNIATTTDLNFIDSGLAPGLYTYGVTAVYDGVESTPAESGIAVGDSPYLIMPEVFSDSFPNDQTSQRTITFYNNSPNAVTWQAATNNYYLLIEPQQGTIPAGSLQNITLTFYVYGFNPGTYNNTVTFTTSDASFPVINYPIQFNVFTQPEIYLYQTELDFGQTALGQTTTRQLMIYNGGYDTLRITNISTSDPSFYSSVSSIDIAPFYQMAFVVYFTPQNLQYYNASLTFDINIQGSNPYTVPLTGNAILQGPLYLNAALQPNNDVQLEWLASSANNGNWISYCSETISTSLGLGGAGTFQMAARWPAGTLSTFDGLQLVKTAFFPTSATSYYTLKIWTGPNAETLLVNQPITTFNVNQVNEVVLNSQVVIDATRDLWIGYEIQQLFSEYPAAVTNDQALGGLSDLINLGDGWATLTEYGFPNSWYIKGFISQSGTLLPLASPVAETKFDSNPTAGLVSQRIEQSQTVKSPTVVPVFQGYNLYRNGQKLNNDLLQEMEYTDPTPGNGTFTYGITTMYDLGESLATEKLIQIGGPVLSVSPQPIVATIEYGQTATLNLVFSNTGQSTLTWSAYDLPYFYQLNAANNSIEPGQSVEVAFTILTEYFTPGFNTIPIRIQTNNLNNPITVVPTEITVELGDLTVIIESDTLDFGMVPLNQYVIQQFNVTNGSSFPIYLYAGSDVIYFQPYLLNYYLMPGETTQIVISFYGSQPGLYTGNLGLSTYIGNEQVTFTAVMKAIVSLPPPAGFTGEVDGQSVNLSWYPPGSNPGLLQYGSGTPFTAVGYSSEGTLVAAAKFSPVELMPYVGKQLSSIAFYTWSNLPYFTAKIFTGSNAENLIFEQAIANPAVMGWNEVQLSSPITITADDYLWIGYEMIQTGFDFPAGVDIGPAIEGKGDLVSLNGSEWSTLSNYGLPYNWNIRGTLESNNNNGVSQPIVLERINRKPSAEVPALAIKETSSAKSTAVNGNLLGYNLYRDGQQLNSSLIQVLNYTDLPNITGTINYGLTAVYDIGESVAATIEVLLEPAMNLPEGWEFTRTSSVHNIYIPTSAAMQGLSINDGDMFGVFWDDNGTQHCAGAALYENGVLIVRAYGDNPATPQKDGFQVGDLIHWKFHEYDNDLTYNMNVTYDHSMPNYDGSFQLLGLSMLASMETGITSLNDNNDMLINVYPNPTSGHVKLEGLISGSDIRITDMTGRVLQQLTSIDRSQTLNFENKGVFVIEITKDTQVVRKKIVVN
ncbi:MAG: hypothetical protein FD155_675 [Bacteroidetes bacterium]|nr:MAG: hypothetical protein FD155_675 [Bacteroidota bacterium]